MSDAMSELQGTARLEIHEDKLEEFNHLGVEVTAVLE